VDATLPDWRRRLDRTPTGKLASSLDGLAGSPVASTDTQLPEAPPSSSAAGGRVGATDSPCSTASGASRLRGRRSSQADVTPAVSHFSIAAVLKPGSGGPGTAAASRPGTAASKQPSPLATPGTAASKQPSPLATPGKQPLQAAVAKAALQPAGPSSRVQQHIQQEPAGPQQHVSQHARQVSLAADGTQRAHRRSGSTASLPGQPASADSSEDASAWLPSVRTRLAEVSLQDGGSGSVPLEVGASPQRSLRSSLGDPAAQQQAQARELEPPQQAQQQAAQQGQQGQLTADDHHARGYALRKRGDFAGAVREYSAALALDPTHFKCLFNRAFSLDKVGRAAWGATDWTCACAYVGRRSLCSHVQGGCGRLASDSAVPLSWWHPTTLKCLPTRLPANCS